MTRGPRALKRMEADAAEYMTIIDREDGETAAHYVCRLLYYNIMMLVIPPGTLVREGRIAERLSLSKTPVHQAVALLEQLFLVEVRPQSATYVSRISYDLLRQGAFMRLTIEPVVCSHAAACISAQDLARLRELIGKQGTARDAYEFISLDDEFHHIIYSAAGKELVWTGIKRVSAHFDRMRYMGIIMGRDEIDTKEHEQLLGLLSFGERGNVKAFEELLNHHLYHFANFFEELIASCPGYFDLGRASTSGAPFESVRLVV